MVATPWRSWRWFLVPLILPATTCDQLLSTEPPVPENETELTGLPPNMAAAPPGKCEPPAAWATEPAPSAPPLIGEMVRNELAIDAEGRTWFNQDHIDSDTLRNYIQIMSQMTPSPGLDVRVDPGASCVIVDNVVRTADEFLTCERDCSYEQAPVDPVRLQAGANNSVTVH